MIFFSTADALYNNAEDERDSLVVVAIVVAAIAMVVGIVNLAYMSSTKNNWNNNPNAFTETLDPRKDPLGVST